MISFILNYNGIDDIVSDVLVKLKIKIQHTIACFTVCNDFFVMTLNKTNQRMLNFILNG